MPTQICKGSFKNIWHVRAQATDHTNGVKCQTSFWRREEPRQHENISIAIR
jgi:hypothetical protein